MDYHFVSSDEHFKSASSSSTAIKILKKFLPIFALSAILPVFLYIALGPQLVNLRPRLASQNELRIWLDPHSVVASPGQSVTFDIVASSESSDKLIYDLKIVVPTTNNFNVTPTQVSLDQPFSGRVKVGQVTVTPNKPGTFEVSIPPESVVFNTREIQVITSPAILEVTN